MPYCPACLCVRERASYLDFCFSSAKLSFLFTFLDSVDSGVTVKRTPWEWVADSAHILMNRKQRYIGGLPKNTVLKDTPPRCTSPTRLYLFQWSQQLAAQPSTYEPSGRTLHIQTITQGKNSVFLGCSVRQRAIQRNFLREVPSPPPDLPQAQRRWETMDHRSNRSLQLCSTLGDSSWASLAI